MFSEDFNLRQPQIIDIPKTQSKEKRTPPSNDCLTCYYKKNQNGHNNRSAGGWQKVAYHPGCGHWFCGECYKRANPPPIGLALGKPQFEHCPVCGSLESSLFPMEINEWFPDRLTWEARVKEASGNQLSQEFLAQTPQTPNSNISLQIVKQIEPLNPEIPVTLAVSLNQTSQSPTSKEEFFDEMIALDYLTKMEEQLKRPSKWKRKFEEKSAEYIQLSIENKRLKNEFEEIKKLSDSWKEKAVKYDMILPNIMDLFSKTINKEKP